MKNSDQVDITLHTQNREAINVEIQVNNDLLRGKRIEAYGAKMITKQNTGDGGNDITGIDI